MATLLHIDSSLNGENSVSRAVARSFREAWEQQHPEGTVRYRDLAAEPLPHLDGLAYHTQSVPAEERTPEQVAAFALREELASELEAADAVLIGAPLYNYSIPSNLKAWLDHVIIMGRTAGEGSTIAGKPVTVVTSRGGSYAPGTPMEGNDFAHPYLNWLLGGSLGMDVEFIVPELTLAPIVPAMAGLIGKSKESRERAHEQARERAKALAAQLAA
ncbi:FMN-dependent NADH-azoreductase [Streptomyces hoynatensis]|uniref:FMN dependent NADH:quinone oxidoreductase n=1 Tax=Streptomyces hoynatensis TaxID=1141874 RepID=A0A3A9Z4J4_9ACTN|nr:NAD(P)H-dependent oxidoreductase [Streptomyces hoynatensis]RKN43175.1 FMN-dependent NADH-azoreductase [Streptomyces hoynatensis]